MIKAQGSLKTACSFECACYARVKRVEQPLEEFGHRAVQASAITNMRMLISAVRERCSRLAACFVSRDKDRRHTDGRWVRELCAAGKHNRSRLFEMQLNYTRKV